MPGARPRATRRSGTTARRALTELAEGIGGFEGNAQTLRLLTRLEPKVVAPGRPRGVGLNLTRASLDAAVKYPWRHLQDPLGAAATHKFGVYEDDLPVFEWLREPAPDGRKCLEAQVMDLADDIAYSVHDVEDAVVGGRLDLDGLGDPGWSATAWSRPCRPGTATRSPTTRLPEALGPAASRRGLGARVRRRRRAALASLKDSTSQLIGRFAEASQLATREEYGAGPAHPVRGRPDRARTGRWPRSWCSRALAVTYVMARASCEPLYHRQREVLVDLVQRAVRAGADRARAAVRRGLGGGRGRRRPRCAW